MKAWINNKIRLTSLLFLVTLTPKKLFTKMHFCWKKKKNLTQTSTNLSHAFMSDETQMLVCLS